MRYQRTIVPVLTLALVTALAAASPASAEEQSQEHGHIAAPQSSGAVATRAQGQGVTFDVTGLNRSGITGTVTLRPKGGDTTEVAVALNDARAGPRPIHIHEGTCGDLNPVPEIPLATMANGTSTTEVEASIQQLMSTPRALFIHKSPEELPVFVACADLMVTSEVAAVPATGEGDASTGLAAGLIGLGGALAAAGTMLRRRAHGVRASSAR